MHLTPESSKISGGELIPAGTLAMAHIKVTEIANSKSTGGTYAKAELTLVSGGYAKRKIFINNIMNPDDERNSAKARDMGQSAIARMLEATGLVTLGDVASYQTFSDFRQAVESIGNVSDQGRYVAVKVGIEKGRDGYEDKNSVQSFLSPNEGCGGVKDWRRLQSELSGAPAVPVATRVAAPVTAPAMQPNGWAAPKPGVLNAPSWVTAQTPPPPAAVVDDEVPF